MSLPCSCPIGQGIEFCARHACEKTEHWRNLCRERPDYRLQWDEGRGLGQLVGLRCNHRSTPERCPLCASKSPLTPDNERATRIFCAGNRNLIIREAAGELCVWPAGLILADYIIRHPLRGSVVDIGCGTGIVGVAALSVGCHVTFFDRNPLALQLAKENAQANGFTDFEVVAADWQHDVDSTWSNILGSEIFWDRDLRHHLMRWIALHWNLEGTCLLSYTGESLETSLFDSAALRSSSDRFDMQFDGKHLASRIYEVQP